VELDYKRLQTCRPVAPLQGIHLFPKGKEINVQNGDIDKINSEGDPRI